jgi:hypothetical protein
MFRACHQLELPSDRESAAHVDVVFTLAGQDEQFTDNNPFFFFFFHSSGWMTDVMNAHRIDQTKNHAIVNVVRRTN